MPKALGGFSRVEQDSWGAGIFRGRKAPPDSAFDMVNALIDDEGQPFRRGGSLYQSLDVNATGTPGITGLWDIYTFAGARVVVQYIQAGTWRLAVLNAGDVTPVDHLSASNGIIPVDFSRAVSAAGLTVWRNRSGVLTGYAGTRNGGENLNAGESYTLTNGSRTVTGAGGVNFLLRGIELGDIIKQTSGGIPYIGFVSTVDSATQITLRDPWPGPTMVVNSVGFAITDDFWAITGEPEPLLSSEGGQSAIAAVGSPARLISCRKNRASFSVPGQPFRFNLGEYHELPEAAIITGADAIRDTAILFTTAGVWAISNMNLDPIDDVGNIQHQVAQLSKDVILWNDSGIAGWDNTLLVPGIDDIYIFSLEGPPEPITTTNSRIGARGDIRALYRSYVRAGYRPGLATVFRGHYFLPIITAAGVWVDTLVCRLDRGFAWTRWSGHGAGKGCFATRTGSAINAPRLIGSGTSGSTSRIISLTDAFSPSALWRADADGTAHQFELVTSDIDTGPGSQKNHVGSLRAAYDLAGTDAVDQMVTVDHAVGPEGAAFVADPVVKGGKGSDGTDYSVWRVTKRCERIRFRMRSLSQPGVHVDFDSAADLAEFTFGLGAGTLSVSGGQLVPSNTAEKQLYHSASAFRVVDGAAYYKVVTGASVAVGAVGATAKQLDANNFLMAHFAFAGAASVVQVFKKDGGVFTGLGSPSVVFTPLTATTYWVRVGMAGDLVVADIYEILEPTPGVPFTRQAVHMLTGADAAKFGAGVAGRCGMRMSGVGTDYRFDDFKIEQRAPSNMVLRRLETFVRPSGRR